MKTAAQKAIDDLMAVAADEGMSSEDRAKALKALEDLGVPITGAKPKGGAGVRAPEVKPKAEAKPKKAAPTTTAAPELVPKDYEQRMRALGWDERTIQRATSMQIREILAKDLKPPGEGPKEAPALGRGAAGPTETTTEKKATAPATLSLDERYRLGELNYTPADMGGLSRPEVDDILANDRVKPGTTLRKPTELAPAEKPAEPAAAELEPEKEPEQPPVPATGLTPKMERVA